MSHQHSRLLHLFWVLLTAFFAIQTDVGARPAVALTDVTGRKLTLAAYPQRLISLSPSNTEILFALDLGSKIVGVDHFSDYPPEAQRKPKIGGFNGKYDFEQIVAIRPDLIFAAEVTPPEVIKKLEDLKLAVVVTSDTRTTLESIFSGIMLVGQATGRSDPARRTIESMKQKLDSLRAKMRTAKTKPRVYWELDATDPAKPFTVGQGSFVNDVIALAGGVNVFVNASKAYPQVGAEQVVAANPEVIILSDAAYGITVESVLKRPGWDAIEAIKTKQVYPIEDNLVSRPGPRIVDGLEAAARLIHSELFQ